MFDKPVGPVEAHGADTAQMLLLALSGEHCLGQVTSPPCLILPPMNEGGEVLDDTHLGHGA